MLLQFPRQVYNLVSTYLCILPIIFLSACISPAISTQQENALNETNLYNAVPDTIQSLADADSLTISVKPFLTLAERKALLEEQAQLWRGTPHRFGGTTRAGIDCSALVQTIFDDSFGTFLPRTTAEQSNVGKRIGTSELKAGDLVFYRINARTRHVGIYIDNNAFLHASKSEGVAISSMDNAYWKRRFWMARRILPSNPQENIDHNQPQTPNNVRVKW